MKLLVHKRVIEVPFTIEIYRKEFDSGILYVQNKYPTARLDKRQCDNPNCCGEAPEIEITTDIETTDKNQTIIKFYID